MSRNFGPSKLPGSLLTLAVRGYRKVSIHSLPKSQHAERVPKTRSTLFWGTVGWSGLRSPLLGLSGMGCSFLLATSLPTPEDCLFWYLSTLGRWKLPKICCWAPSRFFALHLNHSILPRNFLLHCPGSLLTAGIPYALNVASCLHPAVQV